MSVKVRCLRCNGMYTCSQRNTRIVGPRLVTICPLCGIPTTKNYSAFLDAQTEHITDESGNYVLHNEKARTMIAMAQSISSIVSSEESFKKKR